MVLNCIHSVYSDNLIDHLIPNALSLMSKIVCNKCALPFNRLSCNLGKHCGTAIFNLPLPPPGSVLKAYQLVRLKFYEMRVKANIVVGSGGDKDANVHMGTYVPTEFLP